MKYKIVEEIYSADLEREVNKLIEKGCIPIGGVCSDTSFGDGSYMYQAMIFGEENEKTRMFCVR